MRRLRRSKGARALLEGPHLVAAAAAAGLELEEVLVVPGFLERGGGGEELRAILAALPEPPDEVAPELLEEIADADSPRGLVAVVRLVRGGVTTLPVRPDGVYLFVEGLQDPGNLGALARSAEAAGAAGLALAPGTVHPNHPRALRGSAGSLLRLPTALGVAPDALDEHLRGAGAAPRWLALAPRGGTGLWRAELDGCRVLALGAEGPGLSPELDARCDLHLTIPLAGEVESLNATVAAAVTLFEIRRRRFASHSDSDSPEPREHELRLEGKKRDGGLSG
ncbi:MAG: RNA methyltransferase [Acidobacteriota bacterium]